MPRILTLDAYRTLKRPRLSWLLPRLVPKPGSILLLGAPKAGKTTLALQLASAITIGVPFLGEQANVGRVFYLQIDPGELVWRQRLDEVVDAGLDLTQVQVVHPDDRPWPLNILSVEGRGWLKEVLEAARPDLVIVDVLRELHTADENDSTAMKAVGDAIGRTFQGYSLLMLHHTPKLEVDPIHSARGSSYLAGKVDMVWLIRRNKLYLMSRLDEDRTIEAKREAAGLWAFPNLEIEQETVGKVLALCEERPDLPHSRLAEIASSRYNLSRATYYRAVRAGQCLHRGSTHSEPHEVRAQPRRDADQHGPDPEPAASPVALGTTR